MEQSEFQPLVINFLQSLKEEVQLIKTDLSQLKTDMNHFKTDMNQFKADIHRRFDEIREEQRIQGCKLEEVYQARKEVTVKFGLQWTFASIMIAIGASTITHFFQ